MSFMSVYFDESDHIQSKISTNSILAGLLDLEFLNFFKNIILSNSELDITPHKESYKLNRAPEGIRYLVSPTEYYIKNNLDKLKVGIPDTIAVIVKKLFYNHYPDSIAAMKAMNNSDFGQNYKSYGLFYNFVSAFNVANNTLYIRELHVSYKNKKIVAKKIRFHTNDYHSSVHISNLEYTEGGEFKKDINISDLSFKPHVYKLSSSANAIDGVLFKTMKGTYHYLNKKEPIKINEGFLWKAIKNNGILINPLNQGNIFSSSVDEIAFLTEYEAKYKS